LYKFNEELLILELYFTPLSGDYDAGNYLIVECNHFMDNRRYVSSGRCIFSGDKYALALDFKIMDDAEIDDCVSSRKMLFTPRKGYGGQKIY
jgi:hypothetical protein